MKRTPVLPGTAGCGCLSGRRTPPRRPRKPAWDAQLWLQCGCLRRRTDRRRDLRSVGEGKLTPGSEPSGLSGGRGWLRGIGFCGENEKDLRGIAFCGENEKDVALRSLTGGGVILRTSHTLAALLSRTIRRRRSPIGHEERPPFSSPPSRERREGCPASYSACISRITSPVPPLVSSSLGAPRARTRTLRSAASLRTPCFRRSRRIAARFSG